jgi:hypothetical protein
MEGFSLRSFGILVLACGIFSSFVLCEKILIGNGSRATVIIPVLYCLDGPMGFCGKLGMRKKQGQEYCVVGKFKQCCSRWWGGGIF